MSRQLQLREQTLKFIRENYRPCWRSTFLLPRLSRTSINWENIDQIQQNGLHSSLNVAKNVQITYAPTNTRISLYGTHHQNLFAGSEIQECLEHFGPETIVALELDIPRYNKLRKMLSGPFYDPLEIARVSEGEDSNLGRLLKLNGVFNGVDFLSAMVHSTNRPYLIDMDHKYSSILAQMTLCNEYSWDSVRRRDAAEVQTNIMKKNVHESLKIRRILRDAFNLDIGFQDALQAKAAIGALESPSLILCNLFAHEGASEHLGKLRDSYMARNLENICYLHPDSHIFAVVGIAHIPGMLEYFQNNLYMPNEYFKLLDIDSSSEFNEGRFAFEVLRNKFGYHIHEGSGSFQQKHLFPQKIYKKELKKLQNSTQRALEHSQLMMRRHILKEYESHEVNIKRKSRDCLQRDVLMKSEVQPSLVNKKFWHLSLLFNLRCLAM